MYTYTAVNWWMDEDTSAGDYSSDVLARLPEFISANPEMVEKWSDGIGVTMRECVRRIREWIEK